MILSHRITKVGQCGELIHFHCGLCICISPKLAKNSHIEMDELFAKIQKFKNEPNLNSVLVQSN